VTELLIFYTTDVVEW